MGLFDVFKPREKDVTVTRSALDEARDPHADRGAVTAMIQQVLAIGIEGKGPFSGAKELADKVGRTSDSDTETVNRIVRSHELTGAAGGFITSLGGFITMPVALPANIFEFYVQATRMVGAIAHVRGYDVDEDDIRSAVLLTLVGSNADEILAKAGVATGAGRFTAFALQRLPRAALMMINKAVGFRLLRAAGAKTLSRFGRAVPLVGGGVGATIDWWMMRRIAEHARQQFPALEKNPLDLG